MEKLNESSANTDAIKGIFEFIDMHLSNHEKIEIDMLKYMKHLENRIEVLEKKEK